MMQLYGYFRSSAAYRVRIALGLKGIDHEKAFIHLTRDGGQQHEADYRKLNPLGVVPTLVHGETVLTQSLAILEYLDEIRPSPPLLPGDPVGRGRVRSIALTIACDTHPLNNLRVLSYLTKDLGLSEADKLRWYRHWVASGLGAVEALLVENPATGLFCHGNQPTLADICLVPQVFNARRFDCDLSAYPTVVSIVDACNQLPAFAEAAPDRQPDAE